MLLTSLFDLVATVSSGVSHVSLFVVAVRAGPHHRPALSADVPFVADSAQLSKKLTSAHYSQVTGATPLA
jgi:hypothetical protein